MSSNLLNLCVSPTDSIRQAITRINLNAKGIVLVTNEEGRLISTITDGDVRRALLQGQNLEAPVSELLAMKTALLDSVQPVTAPYGSERAVLLHLMQEKTIRQIPLLDEDGKVIDLVTLDELMPEQELPLQAVIMAGGSGTRLKPLTDDVPKPMLPVGDRPLMELLIKQLKQAGIRRVNITTHYKSTKITDHFGDGQRFGIELNYVNEDRPLGTAGALGMLQATRSPLLVVNGDILTSVDFRAMLAYHREHKAMLTVGVRKYDLNVPYGVVESDGAFVQGLVEKPLLSFLVNAGIYLLEPSVYSFIPNDQHYNMTDLIQRLIGENYPVVSFPILEYWLDIGNHVDYQQAQDDLKNGRFKFELG